MKRLVKTFSFRVISSNNSSATEQQIATDELIKEIINLNAEENDNISLLRILCYTRFRLQSLQKNPSSDGEGEKCGRIIVCH